MIKNYVSYGMLLLLAALACSDIFLLFSKTSGPVSSVLYVTVWSVVMLYGSVAAGTLITGSLRHPRRTGVFLVWLLFVFFIAWTLPHSRAVSGEATQEVACGMQAMAKGWDGWKSTCFFGYPVRQYVAMALPSVVFGRSIESLRLGIAVPFILSLAVYVAGLFEAGGSVVIPILAVGLMLHSGFVIRFLFWYEQSILPMILVMGSTGAYLLYRAKHNPVHLSMAIAAATLGASVYTPMIAFLPVAVGVLIAEARHRKYRAISLAGIGILLASYTISFFYRNDVRLVRGGAGSIPVRDVWEAVQYLTVKTSYYPYGSWVFRAAVFAAFAILFTSFGLPGIFAGLWAAGTVIASVLSVGYVWYGVDFRLHRSMVMYPVLFTAWLVLGRWMKKSRAIPYIAAVISLGVAISGAYVAYAYGLSHQSNAHGAVIHAVVDLYGDRLPPRATPLRVLLIDREYDTIRSLADELRYFLPGAETEDLTDVVTKNGCAVPAADLVIVNTANPCFSGVGRDVFGLGYAYRLAKSESNEFFIFRPVDQ